MWTTMKALDFHSSGLNITNCKLRFRGAHCLDIANCNLRVGGALAADGDEGPSSWPEVKALAFQSSNMNITNYACTLRLWVAHCAKNAKFAMFRSSSAGPHAPPSGPDPGRTPPNAAPPSRCPGRA